MNKKTIFIICFLAIFINFFIGTILFDIENTNFIWVVFDSINFILGIILIYILMKGDSDV